MMKPNKINLHPDPLAGLWEHKNATEVESGHAQNEHHAAQVAEVRQKMQDALSAVIEESRLAISPDKWRQWRATRRTRGNIQGVVEAVWCIATDGILAIFVFDGGLCHPSLGTAFKGHVSHFEWDEEIEKKVKVKDDDTKEEKVITARQHKGPPPPLFSLSKPKATPSTRAKQTKSSTDKIASKRAKALAMLEELGL